MHTHPVQGGAGGSETAWANTIFVLGCCINRMLPREFGPYGMVFWGKLHNGQSTGGQVGLHSSLQERPRR